MPPPKIQLSNALYTILTRKSRRPPAAVIRPVPVRRVEGVQDPEETVHDLSPYHAKAAFALRENLMALFDKYPLTHFGFATLTYPDCPSAAAASRRFRNFKDNILAHLVIEWVGIVERSSRRRIHLHLLVVLPFDIQTGWDWPAYLEAQELARQRAYGPRHALVTRRYCSSASPRLKTIWKRFREKAPAYGMGRCELVPVRKTGAAVAHYLAKYIGKHIGQRLVGDKRAKTLIASATARKNITSIAWNSPGAKRWRAALKTVAAELKCGTMKALQNEYGTHWTWVLAGMIERAQEDAAPVSA